MNDHEPGETGRSVLGQVIYRIARGAAVVFLALAIYVALTNWAGDGGIWAFRYAAIALAIYALGRTARSLLGR